MTAQVSDLFEHVGLEWSLSAIGGDGGLFDPKQHGFSPVGMSSACWRGYVCTYAVRERRLVLDRLSISNGRFEGRQFHRLEAPALNGRSPTRPSGSNDFGFRQEYRAIDLPIGFTGGLLIARDFIRDLYVHMGFHPAWKFRSVAEVLVDGGTVTAVIDASERMAEIRARVTALKPGDQASHAEVEKWIAACFERRYP
jgi:hypothetical protein